MGRTIVVEVRKAVVAGIKAALEADPAMAGVSCAYGYSAADDERREVVYTARPRGTHEPASMRSGRVFRNERMEFDINILVRSPVDSPEDNDTRAEAIGQVVEEFAADHADASKLGVTGLNSLVMADLQAENMIGPSGSLSLWQYTVRFQSRLT